jgi:hypothetical protein
MSSLLLYFRAIDQKTYEDLYSGELEWDLDDYAHNASYGEVTPGLVCMEPWPAVFHFLNFHNNPELPSRIALAVSGGWHLDTDCESGPRILAPRLVAEISKDLELGPHRVEGYEEPLDEEEVRRRFQYVDQTGLYHGPYPVDQIVDAIAGIRALYRGASEAGDAVVIFSGWG